MEGEKHSLGEIFSPRGVAVVGASPTGNSKFVHALQEAGFPAIYPVNPKYKEAFGLKCYPSVRAIPGVVDHVVVCIPAESVLELLDDCAAKSVKSVHLFVAGFSETGYQERSELEHAVLDKARSGGIRIIGPNCMGLFVPASHLSGAVFGKPMEPGPIAFLSQSGGNTEDFPFYARPRGLNFSKMVSYGNALDVDESELLQYFAQDDETEIIAAYIEGTKDGRRFMTALKEAASRKPVVVYKGGTTEAGKRAISSHTASLARSAAVFGTLCRQANAIQVESMDEMAEVLVALRFVNPRPRGTGVAVVGQGGGATVLAGDEMEKGGFHLPQLSLQVATELRDLLPVAGSIIGNPIDARALMTGEGISAVLSRIGGLPDVHMFVYHLGFHPASRWNRGRFSSSTVLQSVTDAFLGVQRATGKPVLLALRQPPDLTGMRHFLNTQAAFVEAGLPVFHSLRGLAKAMSRVLAWMDRETDVD